MNRWQTRGVAAHKLVIPVTVSHLLESDSIGHLGVSRLTVMAGLVLESWMVVGCCRRHMVSIAYRALPIGPVSTEYTEYSWWLIFLC